MESQYTVGERNEVTAMTVIWPNIISCLFCILAAAPVWVQEVWGCPVLHQEKSGAGKFMPIGSFCLRFSLYGLTKRLVTPDTGFVIWLHQSPVTGLTGYTSRLSLQPLIVIQGQSFKDSHSSGAVWESRWPSWAVRPNEPSGFRGRKDLLNRASALVTTCP